MNASLRMLMGLLACGLLVADSVGPNMGGTWVLNAGASKWGKHARPTSIVIKIDEQGGSFKYSGEVIKPGEEEPREFSFSGALDGKSYPAKGPGGEGTMAFKRIDARTVESLYNSNDKTLQEWSRTTISADGKRLTRELRLKTPTAKESWTEVYDRRG